MAKVTGEARTVEVEAAFGPPTLQGFAVDLENFSGPFDLLLRLIARRQLALTEVALASVTDEFLAYLKVNPDLSSATDFLVVAATLLHMKAAALLPRESAADNELDEDLEAADLLFARLLQYRAFQQTAAMLEARWKTFAGSEPRIVPMEEPYASLRPALRWTVTPEDLAGMAANALADKPRPDHAEHVTSVAASFDVEFRYVEGVLASMGEATFASLVEGETEPAVIVTRFLAVLELYRRGLIRFEQNEPMGDLFVVMTPGEGEQGG